MGEKEIREFLEHLAETEKLATSTRNQALASLVFLYRQVLEIALPDIHPRLRAKSKGWYYLFPTYLLSTQPETGRRIRHHLHASKAQGAFKQIRLNVGITKDLGPHCLRHSYATQLHDSGVQIRRIQKLLGHQSLNTTMI